MPISFSLIQFVSCRGLRHAGLAGLCLSLVMLAGCASVDDVALAHPHPHTPLKVLIVQSPIAVSPDRLQAVFAPDRKKHLTLSAPVLAPVITHSRTQALADMQAAFATHPHIAVVTPPATAKPVIDRIQAKPFSAPITRDEARQLQSSTGADAILRFGITDYGLTPKTWRTSYITFEVVSTLAIAAVIANVGTTVAKGAAGAYLAQETVEETAESYAGFWALDVVCRPVRIKAKLIQPDPLAVVWQDDDTGLADVKLSRLYRKVSVSERDRQLDQSTDYAVRDLVSALADKLNGETARHMPARLKWEK